MREQIRNCLFRRLRRKFFEWISAEKNKKGKLINFCFPATIHNEIHALKFCKNCILKLDGLIIKFSLPF